MLFHFRYRYDTPLNPDELKEIIKKVQAAGYHVIAVCCDMAKPNIKCADGLGIFDLKAFRSILNFGAKHTGRKVSKRFIDENV